MLFTMAQQQRVVLGRLWLSVAITMLGLWWQEQQQQHVSRDVSETSAAGWKANTFPSSKSRSSEPAFSSFSNTSSRRASIWGGGLLLLVEAHESLYSILGVSRSATSSDIKKAFREMSKKYHPDKNKDPSAEALFKKITHAYEVLTNTEKRKVYDAQGLDGLERYEAGMQQGGGGGHPFGDIFGDFFGFGGRTAETPQVPASTVYLKASLEQLFKGDTLHVSFTRPVLCDKADDCYTKKADCKGPGIRVVTQQMGPGFIVQNQIQDDSCVEQGKAWRSHCKACPKGITQNETIDLSAVVEPGMKAGDKIVFEGVGEQRVGYEPGDLVLVVAELPHRRYTRKGDDLEMTMQLSLMEALVGFEQKLIHLDSTPITIKRSDVTYDGQVMVVHGRGMPTRRSSPQFGNLLVKFNVIYPLSLDSKQKALVKQALDGVTYMQIDA